MSEKPKRRWLRIHLLTALLIMVAAGALVGWRIWNYYGSWPTSPVSLTDLPIVLQSVARDPDCSLYRSQNFGIQKVALQRSYSDAELFAARDFIIQHPDMQSFNLLYFLKEKDFKLYSTIKGETKISI